MKVEPVLVYYASILWEDKTIAKYKADVVSNSLLSEYSEKPPPYHRRFSVTVHRRKYCWLVEGPLMFCAIVDEALGKDAAFRFIEHVQRQLQELLHGENLLHLEDDKTLFSVKEDILRIISYLVAPLVGTPTEYRDTKQEESPGNEGLESEHTEKFWQELPLYARRLDNEHTGKGGRTLLSLTRVNAFKKDRRMSIEARNESKVINFDARGRAMEPSQRLEILCENPDQHNHVQRSSSLKVKEQSSQRWPKIKLFFLLNFVIFVILLALGLGLCKGFSCIGM